MSSVMEEIRKIPPVTRFLVASLVAVTVPIKLDIISIHKVIFAKDIVRRQYELWRLYTTFFIGGEGLNFLFDLAMFHRYSNELEEGHYAGRSSDYSWQLLLVGATLISLNIPIGTYVHTRALLVTLVYLSSALAPAGSKTSFYGIITLPMKFLPYMFIALDLITGGPRAAVISTTGAIVGHLWWWGVWDTGVLREWGRAPAWWRKFLGERDGPANMGGGVHVVPPPRAREASRREPVGAHNWGNGRKLGT